LGVVPPILSHGRSRIGGDIGFVLCEAGELFGRQIAERTVRVVRVVIEPPRGRPIIASDALGRSAFDAHASKDVHHLRRFESAIGLESHALAAKDIDYGQEPDLRPVGKHTSCMKSMAQVWFAAVGCAGVSRTTAARWRAAFSCV
jgi:hypothetical protein